MVFSSLVVKFLFIASILQEVLRIKREHPGDNQCIVNDRVKGRLKVTRAFGAGFLKEVCYLFMLILVPKLSFEFLSNGENFTLYQRLH